LQERTIAATSQPHTLIRHNFVLLFFCPSFFCHSPCAHDPHTPNLKPEIRNLKPYSLG
jgi:hypothetical protein